MTGSPYGQPDLHVRGQPGPLLMATYDAVADDFRGPAGSPIAKPDWIVIQESPLVMYSHVPDALRARLSGYDIRHSIRAVNLSRAHVYDQQDAWFLPLGGFEGVSRPGPNFSIYRAR